MYTLNDKRFNIYASATINDVTYPNFLDANTQVALGITEIPDPQPPEDYSDETYYRTEQDDAPYIVYTRKSDEQLRELANSKIKAQIAAIEAGQARAVREAVLGHPAHLQNIEAEIQALRSQIK